jgi:hypothetical protein
MPLTLPGVGIVGTQPRVKFVNNTFVGDEITSSVGSDSCPGITSTDAPRPKNKLMTQFVAPTSIRCSETSPRFLMTDQ